MKVGTGKGGLYGRGGEQGTVPGNNDWALWRSGGEEERAARFLAGSLRDRYGPRFRRAAARQRERDEGWDASALGKEDAPEL